VEKEKLKKRDGEVKELTWGKDKGDRIRNKGMAGKSDRKYGTKNAQIGTRKRRRKKAAERTGNNKEVKKWGEKFFNARRGGQGRKHDSTNNGGKYI